jgi:hypothetical protein
MPLTNGSGSSAIFVIDPEDANKKLIKKSSSASTFLKVHVLLRHFYKKIKSAKEVTKQ